jgi:hypothetical protein
MELVMREKAYHIIRLTAGSTLLVAAVLKGYELSQGPVGSSRPPFPRVIQVVLVELELVLALGLLFAIFQTAVWWLARLAFTVFTAMSLYFVWQEHESCHCFGFVRLDPGITAFLDVTILAALCITRPIQPTATRWRRALIFTITTATAGGMSVAHIKTYTIRPDHSVATISDDPAQWIGRPFPLATCLELAESDVSRHWAVVFYRSGCGHCQDVIKAYQSDSTVLGSPKYKVALVQLPPHSGDTPISTSALHVKLSPTCASHAIDPLVVWLYDGIVERIKEM